MVLPVTTFKNVCLLAGQALVQVFAGVQLSLLLIQLLVQSCCVLHLVYGTETSSIYNQCIPYALWLQPLTSGKARLRLPARNGPTPLTVMGSLAIAAELLTIALRVRV